MALTFSEFFAYSVVAEEKKQKASKVRWAAGWTLELFLAMCLVTHTRGAQSLWLGVSKFVFAIVVIFASAWLFLRIKRRTMGPKEGAHVVGSNLRGDV